jgi:short-subunit dehydrogenase involved in D-alanine esterification of teichoic acids
LFIRVLKAHPDLDSVIFSSGIQRPLDFSNPEAIDLNTVSTELTTNYLSYIHLLAAILPHFFSSSTNPTPNPVPKSLIFISSALGLVPIPTVTNYCASKAALHHLILCIREQLREKRVKVVEIVAPAVKTELHDYHDRDEEGKGGVGMDLGEFVGSVWEGLLNGQTDVKVGMAERCYDVFEERRQGMFRGLLEMMKKQEVK